MFAIIDVPSNLGLRPSGVETLPDALRREGLQSRLVARYAGSITPGQAYDPVRSPETDLLNGPALRDLSRQVAELVAEVISSGDTPIVLAGDCSVILGGLLGTKLALRSRGDTDRTGLLFVDGHVDFYQPEASPTGEVADMDLALATGRGPDILARLDGPTPLVRDSDVVAVGARDGDERLKAGAQDIALTKITIIELHELRRNGIERATEDFLKTLTGSGAARFWCHLDADVLHDDVMPAVDYRQPDGLTPAELTTLLTMASHTRKMAGMSVAIYNPALDRSGKAARVLVDVIVDALAGKLT